MNDFASRLAAVDADYESVEAIKFGDLEPGKHVGKIEVARIEEDNRPGNDNLYLKLHVRTPDGMGFPQVQLNGHASEKHLSFTKGQLQNLNLECKLSEVPAACASLIGASVEINVTQEDYEGKTYTKYTINKLVSELGTVGFQGIAPNTTGVPLAPAASAPVAAPANPVATPAGPFSL